MRSQNRTAWKEYVVRALSEDVGDGDITSELTVGKDLTGSAELLFKTSGILAGCDVFEYVFSVVDKRIEIRFLAADGDRISRKHKIAEVSGPLRSILLGERVALNFIQRMSGIATLTARFGEIIKKSGSGARIADTRKTTPNFRYFEKRAVSLGGGVNHRMGLYDAVLIKDNHIKAAGGIKPALDACLGMRRKRIKTEIEVKSIAEIKEVLSHSFKPDFIMLDNFPPDAIKKAIAIIRGSGIKIEVSGSITLENIGRYLTPGIDIISSGSLTHSYTSADISLKIT